MRRVFLSFAMPALLFGSLAAAADTLRNGFSTERLAHVDALLQREVDGGRVGGVVALVWRDGVPVYERAIGWRDREAASPMAMDSLFRIASQTKALTSVAVLQLVEEGKLGLDDPAARWIGSFEHTTVGTPGASDAALTIAAAERPITIRDLLTHTAGISYAMGPKFDALYAPKGLGTAAGHGWYFADKDEPMCTTMERLGTLPFEAQPGEQFVYGYATDVLGCIVERVSDLSLDEYFRSRITGPLDMQDTHFYVTPEKRDRLAAVYTRGPDGKVLRQSDGARGQGHYVDGPRRSFSGGAGLVSTARDYATFLEALRLGGALDGTRILSPHAVRLMTTSQIDDKLRYMRGIGFGFGFEIQELYGAAGLESVGSWGWYGAYGTYYRVDPAERLVTVLLLQMLPEDPGIAERFRAAVYGALLE